MTFMAMGAAPDLEGLIQELRREFRTFRLIPKERSLVMRALYWGLAMPLWCPRFMSDFTTVIITWVYMPERMIGTPGSYSTLRHERVHMRDCLRTGVIPFALSYVLFFPAVLTLRSVWEMRAYEESMRVERELTGSVSDAMVRHVAAVLTSSSYLWMYPFPSAARRWAERMRARVLSERR